MVLLACLYADASHDCAKIADRIERAIQPLFTRVASKVGLSRVPMVGPHVMPGETGFNVPQMRLTSDDEKDWSARLFMVGNKTAAFNLKQARIQAGPFLSSASLDLPKGSKRKIGRPIPEWSGPTENQVLAALRKSDGRDTKIGRAIVIPRWVTIADRKCLQCHGSAKLGDHAGLLAYVFEPRKAR